MLAAITFLFYPSDLTAQDCDGCPPNILSLWPNETVANVLDTITALIAVVLIGILIVTFVVNRFVLSPCE